MQGGPGMRLALGEQGVRLLVSLTADRAAFLEGIQSQKD